jgi:hypothetical protein
VEKTTKRDEKLWNEKADSIVAGINIIPELWLQPRKYCRGMLCMPYC